MSSKRKIDPAHTVVLTNENDGEYTCLLESYVDKFQPADPVEMDLVVDMVNAKWRHRRLFRVESSLYEEQMQKQKEELEAAFESYNESVEHAFAFRKLSESGCITMLSRAESRLERTYSRALRNLLLLRQETRKNDVENRTQSQDRTPTTDPQPPLNRQPPLNHQPPLEQSGADDRISSSAIPSPEIPSPSPPRYTEI
jgi:hypothetical protein